MKNQETEKRTHQERAEEIQCFLCTGVLIRGRVIANIKKEDLNGRWRRCRDIQVGHGSPRLANRDRHLQGDLGKIKGKRNDVSESETMQRGCKKVIRAAWHLVSI